MKSPTPIGDHHCARRAAELQASQAEDVARRIRPETAPLWAALRDVLDPEIPVSVVDLGLVCDIRRDGHTVEVDVTFTSTACPAVGFIKDDIRSRLLKEDGVASVTVNETWEVNWSAGRVSGCGREEMRLYGITL